MSETEPREFHVAFSYASEDRAYVEAVAAALGAVGVRIFYDRFEAVRLWGKDLYDELRAVYRDKADFCVMFVSKHYVKKSWTSHERQSAQARALQASAEYILPVRFDDSEVPGLNTNAAYLDLNSVSPEELSLHIITKLKEGGVFGTSPLQTVAERAAAIVALREQLETITADPDFPPDDPFQFRACPKCGDAHLRRHWGSGGRSGMSTAEVRCSSCGWSELALTSVSLDLVKAKYPDATHGFN